MSRSCAPDQQGILAAGGWDTYADPTVGEWAQIDAWVRSLGLDPGPAYMAQTYGGGHSSTSWHYVGRGALARDYGASGVNHVEIARRAEPLAVSSQDNLERYGHAFPIRELFCEEVGIRYSGGARASFRDSPDHTHIAKVAGIRLTPTEPTEEDDLMAAADEIITRVDKHLDAMNQEQKDFVVDILTKVQSHLDGHLDAIYKDINGRLSALEKGK